MRRQNNTSDVIVCTTNALFNLRLLYIVLDIHSLFYTLKFNQNFFSNLFILFKFVIVVITISIFLVYALFIQSTHHIFLTNPAHNSRLVP